MTPAIEQVRAAGIAFEMHVLPTANDDHASGCDIAAQTLASAGLALERVFKTLIVRLDGGELATVVVPIEQQLDLRRLAAAAGARRASMAQPVEAERATGYRLGAISPLGQRRRLPLWIDESAFGFPTIYVSAGRRGLEIELAAKALCDACDARVAQLTRRGSRDLR